MPGQPHPQHLHGSAHGGHFGCPTLKKNDTDGDGVLTNEEATGEYGTIFMALTTSGGATPGRRARRGPDAGRRLPGPSRLRANLLRQGGSRRPAGAPLLGARRAARHRRQRQRQVRPGRSRASRRFAKNLGVDGVPEEATNPASCGVVKGAGAGKPARNGVETGGAPASDEATARGSRGCAPPAVCGFRGFRGRRLRGRRGAR